MFNIFNGYFGFIPKDAFSIVEGAPLVDSEDLVWNLGRCEAGSGYGLIPKGVIKNNRGLDVPLYWELEVKIRAVDKTCPFIGSSAIEGHVMFYPKNLNFTTWLVDMNEQKFTPLNGGLCPVKISPLMRLNITEQIGFGTNEVSPLVFEGSAIGLSKNVLLFNCTYSKS